jgi:hypothetical protein
MHLSRHQSHYYGRGSSVTASAGSRLPPTDTAQLLDESPAIQQLVSRFGKRPGEARPRCAGQRKRHRGATNLPARALRLDTPE